MATRPSVTLWISDLKAGDEAAAERLWTRYSRRLLELARKCLRGSSRRMTDEDDVVQSAFLSFWRGTTAGRFSQLRDRDNLWPLLEIITRRKAIDVRQRERRQKRGGGTVRGESAIDGGDSQSGRGIERTAGSDLSPDRMAEADEMHQRLLDSLNDDTLRRIALWKAEGRTNEEIAEKLSCARSTVVRKLDLIRRIWSKEVQK
ncbi:MAG: sigma-70 family RNA polymerase sigma factor [Planctomycetaceae bacterium]